LKDEDGILRGDDDDFGNVDQLFVEIYHQRVILELPQGALGELNYEIALLSARRYFCSA
jgi:hypothetical protein